MIYVYDCSGCGKKYEVVKSVRHIDREELCPVSSVTMTRAFAPAKIYLQGTAVQEKVWQPALGRAATRKELESEAKAKGWIELGNEDPSKHLSTPKVEYPSFSDDDLKSLANK